MAELLSRPLIKAFVRSRSFSDRLLFFVALLCLLSGCNQGGDPNPVELQRTEVKQETEPVVEVSSIFSDLGSSESSSEDMKNRTSPIVRGDISFKDVASQIGLSFRYDNGADGQQLMVEATGGGCGWIDFDRDGFEDLYFPQGGNAARSGEADQPSDQLFRNIAGAFFKDASLQAGVSDHTYGQGVTVGDYNNDGFDDIFVTNVGRNQLLQNQGDGSFIAVSESAGFFEELWSSSAAWGDIDLDGDLDLYVCNYCDYDPKNPMICRNSRGIDSICHPKDVVPVADECYRNLGDGIFQACAKELGLFGDGNRGLGVVIADFDNDHWPDIYVANDTTANFLFVNTHGQSFQDVASIVGCAVNSNGMAQASMGIACGDYDRNGMLDLYLTHFTNEWNTLYANLGEKGFYDRTAMTNLVVPTMSRLAFGTLMADFNQDGFMEIFVANGHINPQEADGDGYPMRPQLFSYNGSGWDDVGDGAGDYFRRRVVGRGVATGDFDADGRLDLCVVHHDTEIALLHNESTIGNWLQLRLIGTGSSRSAVGSRVHVTIENQEWMAELAGGTSYCSSMQGILSFGLPVAAEKCRVRIEWPSGSSTVLENVVLNQMMSIVEPASDAEPARSYVLQVGR